MYSGKGPGGASYTLYTTALLDAVRRGVSPALPVKEKLACHAQDCAGGVCVCVCGGGGRGGRWEEEGREAEEMAELGLANSRQASTTALRSSVVT